MSKCINEIGNQHGRLVVIKRADNSKHGNARWLCHCDCGNITVVRGLELRSGHTKSCGCLYQETIARMSKANRLPKGEASFNALIGGMKRHAKDGDRVWSLTRKQVRELTKQSCRYCGAEPAQIHRLSGINGYYTYNGLDRVDNEQGYEIDNVVPCCGICNKLKGTMSIQEFLDKIEQIYLHQKERMAIMQKKIRNDTDNCNSV